MANNEPLEPPMGMCSARLDETGQLELPAEWQRYLAAIGGTNVRLYWRDDHLEVITEETYQERRQAASMPLGEALARLRRAGLW